jgi:hypothetical protein
LTALSSRLRQRGLAHAEQAQTNTLDAESQRFSLAAALLRRSHELLQDRRRRALKSDPERHRQLSLALVDSLNAGLYSSGLRTGSLAAAASRLDELPQDRLKQIRAAHAESVRALSRDREWWRVYVPSTGAVVDVRDAQLDWPWDTDADLHAIRPGDSAWRSIVQRSYLPPRFLPHTASPLRESVEATASAPPTMSEREASDVWLAYCGMPPARYLTAAQQESSTDGPNSALPRVPGLASDIQGLMRRLGVIDPWSPAAAQIDAAAAAQAAREADAAEGMDGRGLEALDAVGPTDETGAEVLPAMSWELAALPQLDAFSSEGSGRGRAPAPVATAAFAAPAESVSRRVRAAFEAAQSAFRTREIFSDALSAEARLVSEVAARRIQHAWRGSRKIAKARAELWARRERVRSAALNRLATVQDAMVQFCRVLEQGAGVDVGAAELAAKAYKATRVGGDSGSSGAGALRSASAAGTANTARGSLRAATAEPPTSLRDSRAPSAAAAAAAGAPPPTSISASIDAALGSVTAHVSEAARIVASPGRASTPVALRIAGGAAAAGAAREPLLPVIRPPGLGAASVGKTASLPPRHSPSGSGAGATSHYTGSSANAESLSEPMKLLQSLVSRGGGAAPGSARSAGVADSPRSAALGGQPTTIASPGPGGAANTAHNTGKPPLSLPATPRDGSALSFAPSPHVHSTASSPRQASSASPSVATTSRGHVLQSSGPLSSVSTPRRSAGSSAAPVVSRGHPSTSSSVRGGVQPVLGSSHSSMASSSSSAATFAGLASLPAGAPLFTPVAVDSIQARRAAARYSS